MVNNYMKELCAAGLLEYRRKNSKSVSYHVVPAGREYAAKIELDLMREIVELFAESKARVRDVILGGAGGAIHRVVLFGSGHEAELAFHALEGAGIQVIGVCDGDASHIGREWCGRELINPAQIRYVRPDAVVIASFQNCAEICRSLDFLQGSDIRLIRLGGLPADLPRRPSDSSVQPDEPPASSRVRSQEA
jgi:hypothetical protein